MKKIQLTLEELEIEENADLYKSISKTEQKHIETLIEKSRKSKAISLRISEADLQRLKEKAAKTGLPYQTLINMVLHQYVTDGFFDKYEIQKLLKAKAVFQMPH